MNQRLLCIHRTVSGHLPSLECEKKNNDVGAAAASTISNPTAITISRHLLEYFDIVPARVGTIHVPES